MDVSITEATEVKEDTAIIYGRHVAKTKYEDIPTEALEVAKKQILDVVGVILGGSATPGCKELVELIREWGGKEESTILAYGDRVPAPNAAQANATMADALDYDDTSKASGVHSGTVVVPSCLAMAEHKGNVSGKEFLTAVALGFDLDHRLGKSTVMAYSDVSGLWNGWELTPIYGYFASAAAGAKILGLDEEKMVNAFGIAYEQTAGNLQCILEGTLMKRFGPGFAARGGIVSAVMAERGITGVVNSLEGKAGFFNVYFGGSYDRQVLTADLGKSFEGVNSWFKAYPCCAACHNSIDATLALVKEYALKPEDVAEVTVSVGRVSYLLNCEPLEQKRSPSNVVQTQFNVPWAVATTIVHGKPLIKHFTAKALKDRTVLQMVQKVIPRVDDSLNICLNEPAIVEIRTRDGRLLSKRVDSASGTQKNPMSWEDIIGKFRDCASYAVKPVPRENLEKAIEMIKGLEQVDDISFVIQMLS